MASRAGESASSFNPQAVAQLVHHFEVELSALAQPLLFKQFIVRQQDLAAVSQPRL